MQKVEGSNPFSRFSETPLRRGFLLPGLRYVDYAVRFDLAVLPFMGHQRSPDGGHFRMRDGKAESLSARISILVVASAPNRTSR